MAVTHNGDGTSFISTSATLRPDGAFALDGVIGPATLYVRDLPSRWTVKAIELGNSDITDRPTDYAVVVFPADTERWTAYLPVHSRHPAAP